MNIKHDETKLPKWAQSKINTLRQEQKHKSSISYQTIAAIGLPISFGLVIASIWNSQLFFIGIVIGIATLIISYVYGLREIHNK